MTEKLRHLDLFAGIGGFSLAAELTGMIETVGFCEIDPWCRSRIARQYPGIPHHDDVETLTGSALGRFGRIDIVTGGYPCQPFSLAGKRMGDTDDRHLWPHMRRVIDECRPRFVIAENVVGHISMGIDVVLSDLEESGYTARPVVLPAGAVDARHRRERVWILAHANREGEPVGTVHAGQIPRQLGFGIPDTDDIGRMGTDDEICAGWETTDAGSPGTTVPDTGGDIGHRNDAERQETANGSDVGCAAATVPDTTRRRIRRGKSSGASGQSGRRDSAGTVSHAEGDLRRTSRDGKRNASDGTGPVPSDAVPDADGSRQRADVRNVRAGKRHADRGGEPSGTVANAEGIGIGNADVRTSTEYEKRKTRKATTGGSTRAVGVVSDADCERCQEPERATIADGTQQSCAQQSRAGIPDTNGGDGSGPGQHGNAIGSTSRGDTRQGPGPGAIDHRPTEAETFGSLDTRSDGLSVRLVRRSGNRSIRDAAIYRPRHHGIHPHRPSPARTVSHWRAIDVSEDAPTFGGSIPDTADGGLPEPSRRIAPEQTRHEWANGTWEIGEPRVTFFEPERRHKLKAAGNAIVPQVAYYLFLALIDPEGLARLGE